MKNKILWQSWDLMSEKEQQSYLTSQDLLDCYLDNTNQDIDDYDTEEFENYCREVNGDYFYDDFGKDGNWAFSSLKNARVVVSGSLGLWDGAHTIEPKEFDNLYEAIQQCIGKSDYVKIEENRYGGFNIYASHHDGTNHFIIRRITDKGYRALHFSKEVFGVGA